MSSVSSIRRALRLCLLCVAALAVSAGMLRAEVKLSSIFGSHMVLQRNLPVHVWGLAEPGETVEVSFRDETRTVKANDLGRWSVYLSAPTPPSRF